MDSVRQMEMWEQWVVPAASMGSGTDRAFGDCPILQVRKMRDLQNLKRSSQDSTLASGSTVMLCT